MALRLAPSGQLHLDAGAEADAVPPARAERIRAAFEGGAGPGVLHLGAVEVSSVLPPSLAWFRDLGKLFVSRLCGLPDLEQARERAVLPPPGDELRALAAAPPPMQGAEYLDATVLESLWIAVGAAFRDEMAHWNGSVESFLADKNEAWSLVGRVCFHLAENRADPERPFAFLATYTTGLSVEARARHRPLGEALRAYAGEKNRGALLALLRPVDRAAAKSALVKQLVDAGELFQPLAWTVRQAHRFLREVPLCEEAGVVVRVPDWWRARRRVQVGVTVGSAAPSQLGLNALLDFSVGLALDGEPLSDEEWRTVRASSDGLALIRGKWVEVDRARLDALLAHWRSVQKTAAKDGLSFLDGMRLLAGARLDGDAVDEPEAREWSRLAAGDWLSGVLDGLRGPDGLAAADPGEALRTTLRSYQRVGVSWLRLLHRLGLGACLADDMGLGKTIQVLALLVLLQKERAGPSLLVAPTSLLGNWQAEIERFAPSLRVFVAHPSAAPGDAWKRPPDGAPDLVITTYGSVPRIEWLGERDFALAVLDEAQAVKNPAAKQTRAVKTLRARARIALTGTPVENRLSDLWSLFDFINPGLLGSAKAFGEFAKRIAAGPTADYGPLRNLIRPYLLRRMKTDRAIVPDLPEKTEVRVFCALTRKQAALYQQSVEALAAELRGPNMKDGGIKRRGAILAFLLRFKQICNHPSHRLGDGGWSPLDSGKFARLAELSETIAARQEKALVFTQFRETTAPLAAFLATAFGRPGLVLHGDTPVKDRRALCDRFQSDDDVPFFVLSVKAGGTGLNLTAASHVIHFDRWWNPAVEDQATDRAHRIGQKRSVLVHKFVCRGTVEERIDALIESKRAMARELLAGGGEALVTELGDRELIDLVSLDIRSALAEG